MEEMYQTKKLKQDLNIQRGNKGTLDQKLLVAQSRKAS